MSTKRIIPQMLTDAAIIAGVFGLDQWTKSVADARIPENGVALLGNIFGLIHHHNFGLLANLPVPQWIILSFTSLVIIALFALLVRHLRDATKDFFRHNLALSVLLGGALGNFYDRAAHGYVFDWMLLFNRSVINVADIAIAVGILWYTVIVSRNAKLPAATQSHSS